MSAQQQMWKQTSSVKRHLWTETEMLNCRNKKKNTFLTVSASDAMWQFSFFHINITY